MKKVLVINNDSLKEIKLINKYDNSIVTVDKEQTKKTTMSEEEYKKLQRKSNELEHQLVLEQDNKKEICYISGLRDIKQATLSFNDPKNISKKILTEGVNYAENVLGMETIFINVEQDSPKLTKLLENQDFINIGEVNGKTTYLKEKDEDEIGSMRCEHRKKF